MGSLPSWVGRALQVSLLRNSCWRIGGYIAYEWDFWKATRMLSLKQLHTELLASAFPGDDRNTERRALIALIAEDLRDAELWPTAGRGPEAARPLAEWRDRYEGIDRHLRYSGTP